MASYDVDSSGFVMKVAIALPQVPFIRGGAEAMANSLLYALKRAGHSADIITMPFRFSPEKCPLLSIKEWQSQDFNTFDIGNVDRVIALKFPAYFVNHPGTKIWLLHQHRAAYELAGTDWAFDQQGNTGIFDEIRRLDSCRLSQTKDLCVISDTVGNRLLTNNGVVSKTIYPPPPHESKFRSGLVYPYIFFPSRLERLKRQDLLIRAMAVVKSPIKAVLAGVGGAYVNYSNLIKELSLEDKVFLLGSVDQATMVEYYRNSLAVCFTPFDEDYGFVTAEAMLSAKPVITCTDSGGPTELVLDRETGFVVPPHPEYIAESIEWLWGHRSKAIEMGVAGRDRYANMNITWDYAIENLIGHE